MRPRRRCVYFTVQQGGVDFRFRSKKRTLDLGTAEASTAPGERKFIFGLVVAVVITPYKGRQ